MKFILDEKDAAEWIYRGEGAANLVLGYNGASPAYVGKVLRIQKTSRKGPQSKSAASILSADEILLWKDSKDIVSSTSKETVGQLYVLNVMLPLLGSEHVDAGMRILVSRKFLEGVENNILSQRPGWRVDAAKVNTYCDSALLISDHSVFSHGIRKGDPCISVEIKPKCGFLPSSLYMKEENAIKKSVTRFRMHQFLKLHQGEVSQISEYNPLDMFSGSTERTNNAIKTLFATPQNNLRIFLNGTLIFGGLGGGANTTNSTILEALEDQIKEVISADYLSRLEIFSELISNTIIKSGVLDRLLKVQRLDSLDIEGAIHAYYDLLSQPCEVCKDLGDNDKYSSIHSLTIEESRKIVRDYLISATAKDCSLMISFRPSEGNQNQDSMYLESTNQSFDYKAYFIDLDMKPLKKMVQYYELDQKILSYYRDTQEMECGTSESHCS